MKCCIKERGKKNENDHGIIEGRALDVAPELTKFINKVMLTTE